MTGAPQSIDTDVRIRAATMADVPGVVEIERECFAVPWSARSFAALTDVPGIAFLVAVDPGERVLGFTVLYIAADECELANLAVGQAQRRLGVGRRLLHAALDRARMAGALAVFLEVRESNDSARLLYASAGFREVGKRARYYTHPIEDARVMRLDLGPAASAAPHGTRMARDTV